MKMMNNPAYFRFEDFDDYVMESIPTGKEDVIDWIAENVNLSEDISAERKRIDYTLSPFIIDPLRTWDFSGKIREVVVCGPEQMGKTMIESSGASWVMKNKPCSMLCVYPSDELASSVNTTKYEPILRHIPSLAKELARPHAVRKDRYILGAATMYFQGAGAKVMSRSCKVRIADEEDQYPKVGILNAIEDIRKRARSYSESIFFRVCTPTEKTGSIWIAFLAGSQGYWTMRCKGCGELTMKSCDLNNLQFESTFDETRGIYTVKPSSIRLICPACKHEHRETDKRWMNLNGKYIHEFPDRIDLKPSFQFGALASQFPALSWMKIAEKILECGKRSDIKAHYELDNSYKGLPYTPREISSDDCRHLKEHMYRPDQLPPADEIEMVFLVSDTQDDFSPTGVFALDVRDNLWLLQYGNVTHLWLTEDEREKLEASTGNPVETVEDILNKEYRFEGGKIRPTFHVLDYRGHRQREIREYAATHKAILYAGSGQRQLERYKQTDKSKKKKMYYVSAAQYQRSLIWSLYRQRNKETDYLYLPEDLDPKYQTEIVCVQPDRTTKSGHLPENWRPEHDAVHDAFDVCKMAFFGKDFAVEKLPTKYFRVGRSPALHRARKLHFDKLAKQQQNEQENVTP